jgi:hypothetical protein
MASGLDFTARAPKQADRKEVSNKKNFMGVIQLKG